MTYLWPGYKMLKVLNVRRSALLVFTVTSSITACTEFGPNDNELRAPCNPGRADVVQRVGIKLSSTMMAGRKARLVGSAYVRQQYDPGFEASLDPLRWQSASPGVLVVHGDSAAAMTAGSALVTAAACETSDSLTVTVMNEGYEVREIAHVDRLWTFTADMNDSGHVVFRLPDQTPGHFIWNGLESMDLVHCAPVAINAHADVLCGLPGPTIWTNGVMTTLDTHTVNSRSINDSGHVLIGSQIWRGKGDVMTLPSPGMGLGGTEGPLNDRDEVLARDSFLYPLKFLWTAGAWVQIAGGRDDVASINDSSDVVGYLTGAYYDGRTHAFLSTAESGWQPESLRPWIPVATWYPFNEIASVSVDINNNREIVGTGSEGPFVWTQGRLTLLNQVLADTMWLITQVISINDRGQILAQATKRTDPVPEPGCHRTCVGVTRLVRLDPP